MEGQADQIEACFRQIGQKTVVPLSILRFSTENQQPKLVFVTNKINTHYILA